MVDRPAITEEGRDLLFTGEIKGGHVQISRVAERLPRRFKPRRTAPGNRHPRTFGQQPSRQRQPHAGTATHDDNPGAFQIDVSHLRLLLVWKSRCRGPGGKKNGRNR